MTSFRNSFRCLQIKNKYFKKRFSCPPDLTSTETSQQNLRKCVVFYAAISAKEINKSFDTSAIDGITKYKIRTDLIPVLIRNNQFDLDIAKKTVKDYIPELLFVLFDQPHCNGIHLSFYYRFSHKFAYINHLYWFGL